MKKFTKLLSLMLAIVIGLFTVGCRKEPLVVTFAEDLPETVQIGTELKIRNYIEEDPEAVYVLYVSYTDPNTGVKVENKKQSSMTFTFELATVYTFKIEMKKNDASATATVSVEALPDAPNFLSVNRVRVEKGATKTFDEIAASANILITPSDLVDDIDFKAVEFTKAIFNSSEPTVPNLKSTRQIGAEETTFTFEEEGTYVFDISATNKSGTAVNQLTVTNVDSAKQKAKTEASYNAESRILSWQPVEGATAYRLEDGTQVKTLTETTCSFMGYEDGAYTITLYPVYDETVYVDAKTSVTIDVGYVRTPMELTKRNYTVSWTQRLLATKYLVTENGGTEIELAGDTCSYTLQGTYTTHSEVVVTVKAAFEDNTTTESASVKIKYGTVTFDAWDLNNAGTTTNSNDIKAYSGIDTVCVGTGLTDAFIMVEYTGKNVPNFAVRATGAYSTITDADIAASRLWHNPGIFMFTSFIHINAINAQRVYVNRGLCASGGNFDGKGIIEADTANGIGGGLTTMRDNVKYIMIMSYEVVAESTRNESKVTCYLMSVENETVTKVYQMSLIAPSTTHSLNGDKVILYPAVSTQKAEPITFTYYPAKATLASVVNDSTSPYKEGIKAALGLN